MIFYLQKAYQLIFAKYKIKNSYSVHIKKKIPLFAGLGGGSSNAAHTLLTLNKICNLQIKKEGSFAENYPELLKEWDYKKNKKWIKHQNLNR